MFLIFAILSLTSISNSSPLLIGEPKETANLRLPPDTRERLDGLIVLKSSKGPLSVTGISEKPFSFPRKIYTQSCISADAYKSGIRIISGYISLLISTISASANLPFLGIEYDQIVTFLLSALISTNEAEEDFELRTNNSEFPFELRSNG